MTDSQVVGRMCMTLISCFPKPIEGHGAILWNATPLEILVSYYMLSMGMSHICVSVVQVEVNCVMVVIPHVDQGHHNHYCRHLEHND